MRKFLLTAFIFSTFFCFAQQNLPLNSFVRVQKSKTDTGLSLIAVFSNTKDVKANAETLSSMIAKKIVEEQEKQEVHHFTLYGIGKLDDETLQKLNGSGKLALGFCPNPVQLEKDKDKPQTNFFAAFNKNATNNDSLLASTLVYPEVGAQSLLLSAMPQWLKMKDDSLVRHFGIFGEFACKQIKTGIDSLKGRTKELSINTLHWAAGFEYGFTKSKLKDGKLMSMGVNATALISYTNIPDEDDNNFKMMVGEAGSRDDFWSAGCKITFEINGFQLFADLRHVFGSESSLPVKELRGFNSNIGVTFSTDILSF